MTTDKLEQATSLLSQWYHDEIRSLADDAVEACVGRLVTAPTKEDLAGVPREARASARAGFVPYRVKSDEHAVPVRASNPKGVHTSYVRTYQERSDGTDRREFLQEWVEEATDGHEFVIYTHKAQLVVATSRNDGAYEDNTGEKPPTVEAQACAAMRADVWELLEAREEEWEGEDPEPEDDDDGSGHEREICPCDKCREWRRPWTPPVAAYPNVTSDDPSTLAVADLNAFHGMPRARS